MRRKSTLLVATLILGAVILTVPVPVVRYVAAFVLLWVLSGLAWGALVPRIVLDRVERLAVSLGLGFVVVPAITLLFTYFPGPLNHTILLSAFVLGGVGLPLALATLMRRKVAAPGDQQADTVSDRRWRLQDLGSLASVQHPLWRNGWAWLLVAVLVATGLRVINLDYAEFQGDEATVLVRAAQVIEGDETAIFQHKKGPGELLPVIAGWQLTGVTGEWAARLPFTWANVLGVATVFLCGRRLGRPHAGGIAACLLAIEGFFVGFGRIVQYQSLVFVLGTLGLLCLLAYYAHGCGFLVIISAAFFATGALAHYDAIMALPAGLLLVVARLWFDRRQGWRPVVSMVVAALTGAALLGLFYGPFLFGPYVEHTSFYVSGRIGGSFYNHLGSTFELSAVYDAVYLLVVMALALAGRLLLTWARWGCLGLSLSGALLALVVTGWVWPDLWIANQLTLAWIPVVVLLAGALLAPGQPMGVRALWLWLGLPTVFYLFFVSLPLTHIHTAFPAWSMLAAMGLADLGCWLGDRSKTALRWVGAGGLALYVLCGFYAVVIFVDHVPEYRRTFPRFKHPLYWTPYEQMPEAGLFGFPYRVGWKVVGRLMDEQVLTGTYDSNEEREITDYYTHQTVRLNCASPDMYIVAANVQDEVDIRWDQIEEEYQPAVVVTVGGQPKIIVYRHDVVDDPLVYQAEVYDWPFDLDSTPASVAWPVPSGREVIESEEYVPREATFGNVVQLLGYKVDVGHAIPGGYVELTLLWQALEPTSVNYHVFTHLYDGEMMWGQLDGQPVCGSFPTSGWQPGQIIVDPYRIPISSDVPSGSVPLIVGMYDFATMQRLPVLFPDGVVVDDKVYLNDVHVRGP